MPTPDFVLANKQHFDSTAQHYDQMPCVILSQKSAHAMMKAYAFSEDETHVMDYACGTGLVSRELVPYVKTIVGVDISQGMVDQYNLRVYNQGIPPEEMHAICAKLEGNQGELDGKKFDVVVCASAYHHIQSIEHITQILAYFLKPGGVLLVVDLEKTEVGIHIDSHREIVPHRGGIAKADIECAFKSADLESFTYERAFGAKLKGAPVNLFIAKGFKSRLAEQ